MRIDFSQLVLYKNFVPSIDTMSSQRPTNAYQINTSILKIGKTSPCPIIVRKKTKYCGPKINNKNDIDFGNSMSVIFVTLIVKR